MNTARRRGAASSRVIVSACLALVFGIGMWVNTSTLARDVETSTSRRASRASGGSDDQKVEGKLNEIVENQQKILKRLDEIMEELKIVKIRATLR